MAKILDKYKLALLDKRLVKLQQAYEWSDIFVEEAKEQCEKNKQRLVEKKKKSLNKAMKDLAFKSCDKEQYIDEINADKLAKYDVTHYMDYRAINHAFTKQAFKSLAEGTYSHQANQLMDNHLQNLAKVATKRQSFIDKLNAEKDKFLAKNTLTANQQAEADKAYEIALQQANEQLQRYTEEITAKLDAKREEQISKLQAKKQQYADKLKQLKSQVAGVEPLDEDVLLKVRGLKMHFGGLKAVDGLDFDVKKGEIFGLIGPNGAGKTTVFNCITRFYDATAGDMYFSNKYNETVDLRRFKVHDVILQGITRTFQNVELVKEVSVLDNLMIACTREFRSGLFVQALGLPSLRREEKAIRAKAMNVLKFMGLESYANWLAFGLPYGILKKIEIARALMTNAKLIIMDEPAAGLNDTETAELAQLIKRIRDEFNTTILLVEHDMSLVMSICDTICAISFGKMLAIGNAQQIQSSKEVQEAYLGMEEE